MLKIKPKKDGAIKKFQNCIKVFIKNKTHKMLSLTRSNNYDLFYDQV
jgi:hypothetical protein